MVLGSTTRPGTATSQHASPGAAGEPPSEGSQYASKSKLLEWINGLLQLQLSRLEQFASGAVFCQLLDAYFKDAICMHKVNFHASTEYEAHFNYKVLQTGFTAIHLTREMHVNKLARGSRTELLELLQYLFAYLLKLKAQSNYDARERRALAVKGGTDSVAIPAWLSGSQAAGRGGGGMNRSSGNWGAVFADAQQEKRGLHGSISSSPARAAGLTRSSSNTAKGAVAGPCKPAREHTIKAAASPAAAATAARAAAAAVVAAAGVATAAGVMAAGPDKSSTLVEPEDETGVAVYQVVQQEEEQAASGTHAAVDEPASVTRLVIPDEAISSSMMRPLSPGGRSQLELCLGAAEEATRVLSKTCVNMAGISSNVASCADSFVYRGKIRSLLDAAATAASHVELLLADVLAVAATKSEGSAADIAASARALQGQLTCVQAQLQDSVRMLQDTLSTPQDNNGSKAVHLQLTQSQKQLASTAALNGCLRAVGTAYAALLGLSHRQGAAVAAAFFEQPPAAGDAAAATQSKVLKLAECSMKRLRNGDVYRGCYAGLRKNGNGCYSFANKDSYEGAFRDDRMQGWGVYTFWPEGRYEGGWSAARYEGHGSETFAKGSTYCGTYSGGVRHGWGTCRFFNGDFYEGQWSNGLRDGCGMQQCTDDSNYCGQYWRGKRHGLGVYSFANGDQYLGEYGDDIPHGFGEYVFISGQRYQGCWEKGKKHGWSIYTVETGQRWAGSWVEGKPQWVHPLEAGESAAVTAPEVADKLSHAHAACRNAQQACTIAQSKLAAHWAPGGEVQTALAGAVAGARQAAAAAQGTRRAEQQLAARLNAAAVLIQGSSNTGQMRVVAHQLEGLSVEA